MSQKKIKNKLQSIIASILKYVALISIAFSVLSAFLNIFAFRIWGLNFAAIASPSDLILGTLNAFDAIIAYIFLAVVAASIGYFAPEKIKNSRSARIGLSLSFYISSVAAIIGATIYAISNWGYEITELDRSVVMAPWFIFSLLWFSFARHDEESAEILLFLIALGTVSLFAILRFFSGTGGIDLALDQSSRCPTNEYVVWVGVESLVTTCEPPPFRFPRTYFVVQKEGVVLTNRIRQEPQK